MKFVHAADLHVDSQLRGLDRYEGAPAERLRAATRSALANLVTMCLEERVDLLLLAGDVFDGDWRDFGTGLYFAAQMARLREANIDVVIVRGNHDAASSVTKALRLPNNVRELSSKAPETIELARANVCVHGQSFAHRATTEDLAARYPAVVAGAFNIGLLHTCLDGREGHAPYAPTTLEVLRAKGYDYWALGHVHAREVLSEHPHIVFPGNLQGRHVREPGPKGASVVTVDGGVVRSLTHVALDVVRWATVEVDVSLASDAPDAVDLARAMLLEQAELADGRPLAARIVFKGISRANGALRRDEEALVSEVRASALGALGDACWIEKVKVSTSSQIDLAQIRQGATAAGYLARRLHALKADDSQLAELGRELFAEFDRKLPAAVYDDAALRLTDPARLRELVDDIEQSLVPRLLEGRED